MYMIDYTSYMRNNGTKLKCKEMNSKQHKILFNTVVVQEWNKLPPLVGLCNLRIRKLDGHFFQARCKIVIISYA